MKLNPSEYLNQINGVRDRIDKINLLRKVASPVFLQILKHTYEPRITFDVDVNINWKPDKAPHGVNPSNLWQEFRKVKYFYNAVTNRTPMPNRQKVLRDILQSVHEDDAHVLLGIIKGDLPYDTIDSDLVLEAFPNLWERLEVIDDDFEDEAKAMQADDVIDDIVDDEITEEHAISLDDIAAIAGQQGITIADSVIETVEMIEAEIDTLDEDGVPGVTIDEFTLTQDGLDDMGEPVEDESKTRILTTQPITPVEETVSKIHSSQPIISTEPKPKKKKRNNTHDCPICGKKYKTASGLKSHIAKKH